MLIFVVPEWKDYLYFSGGKDMEREQQMLNNQIYGRVNLSSSAAR